MLSGLDRLRIDGYVELYYKKCNSSKDDLPLIIIDGKRFYLFTSPLETEETKINNDDGILSIAQKVIYKKYAERIYIDGKEYCFKVIDKYRYILISDPSLCVIENCSSITSFLTKISELKNKNKNFNIYFRGQASYYSWLPSLFREESWVKNESKMNMAVISKHVGDFADCPTTIERLIKLKHYNQPSRLLDIVENPLMALYFACESSNIERSGGMVSAIFSDSQYEKYSIKSDTVVTLANISNVDYNKYFSSNKKNNLDGFCKEVAHQCRKEEKIDSYWIDLNETRLNNCIIVHPEMNNPRIIHQQGLFILCGFDHDNKKVLNLPLESFCSFFKSPVEQKRIYFKFSKRALNRISMDLDSYGINRSQVYFDLEKTIEYEKDRIKRYGK